jgi:hypothetical protein
MLKHVQGTEQVLKILWICNSVPQASQAPGAYAPGYYESPQTAGYGAPYGAPAPGYGAPAPGYGGPSAPPYGAQGMPAHWGQA